MKRSKGRGFITSDFLIPLALLFVGGLMGYIFNVWVVIILTIPVVYFCFFYRPVGYVAPGFGILVMGYCIIAVGLWVGTVIGYWPFVAGALILMKDGLAKVLSNLLR